MASDDDGDHDDNDDNDDDGDDDDESFGCGFGLKSFTSCARPWRRRGGPPPMARNPSPPRKA